MTLRGWVKVCGVTTAEDAEATAEAGADAIGLNLWPQSPRSVSLETACALAEPLRGQVEIVAVTVNMDPLALEHVVSRLQPDWVQLHGEESETNHLPISVDRAFYAVGLGTPVDVERALRAPGPYVLIDARDDVRKGGTGKPPPASLAHAVCCRRPTVLAGGLGDENVAAAIAAFEPVGVDAASGLEMRPGQKDFGKLQRYVAEARAAFQRLAMR